MAASDMSLASADLSGRAARPSGSEQRLVSEPPQRKRWADYEEDDDNWGADLADEWADHKSVESPLPLASQDQPEPQEPGRHPFGGGPAPGGASRSVGRSIAAHIASLGQSTSPPQDPPSDLGQLLSSRLASETAYPPLLYGPADLQKRSPISGTR